MPHLLSRGPGYTTGIALQQNAFWRLMLGAVMAEHTPALALCLRYPPGADANQVALLRIPVSVAQSAEEVSRIAAVALSLGSLEDDSKRIEEAYALFRNNPRVPSQQVLTDAVERGQALVRIYWQLTDWLLSVPDQEFRAEIENQVLVGVP